MVDCVAGARLCAKECLVVVSGNVWQWVADKYKKSYKGVPIDGSAFEGAGSTRVLRGGCFYNYGARYLRVDFRFDGKPSYRGDETVGFRLAK